MAYILLAIVSFLLGIGVTLVLTRRRASNGEISETVQQSVTAFGEEVGTLSFDPAGRASGDAALKEYRKVLDAYGRAARAVSEETALVALDNGRKALVRLDARVNGRPVPIDALSSTVFAASGGEVRKPERPTGERFLFAGPGPAEFMIDRPEPGRPAIAEVVANGRYSLHPITRTDEVLNKHGRLDYNIPYSQSYDYSGGATVSRLLLEPSYTHLAIDELTEDTQWSVRIRPIADAVPLGDERHGYHPEVLSYEGGPAVLTVQVQVDRYWRVDFRHDRPEVNYSRRARPEGLLSDASGTEEARTKMWLPGPGLLTLAGTYGPWSLHVDPLD